MQASHCDGVPSPITVGNFLAIDIRIGTIVSAQCFPQARKPAFKLVIDFGPVIGRRTSSAQITEHYTLDVLLNRQVAAVVNLPPRQIGKFMSEVLVLGFSDTGGAAVLFRPDHLVPNGSRLF